MLSGAAADALMAGIHVPSGATIIGVDVFVTDSNSGVNLQACLFAMNNLSSYDSFACALTTGTQGAVKLTITPVSPPIQDGNHAFELGLFSLNNSNSPTTWPGDNTVLARSRLHPLRGALRTSDFRARAECSGEAKSRRR